MAGKSGYVISGPQAELQVRFESLGKFLFDSLKKRKATEIIAIDAFTKKSMTCGELLEKSIKLSIALKKLPVYQGDVIGILCENNLQCYIATCASLFCATQLVLLNPAYTPGELRHAFVIAKPKVVFSSLAAVQNVLSVKNEFNCLQAVILMEDDRSLELDTLDQLIENKEIGSEFEPVKVGFTDTVVMCLSSGTTGLPKCVELSHENFIPIMNYSRDNQYLNITGKDTTVVILPFFHIYGFCVHLMGITNSLTVIVMKSFKPDLYLEAIQEYKATKLFIVPPVLMFLLKSPLAAKFNLTSVEDMVVGAASLGKDAYEEALQKFKHCSIRQLYGSTEIGGLCMLQDRADKFITIGKVVSNMSVKVVNVDSKDILGPYENGELCVKSLSVMKGYLNNQAETKDSIDSDGFYHTGDVCYYDKDNNFYFVDRMKELIKYKGFQVAPTELENLLQTHSGVKDCAVLGIEDERCGQLPLAFVVRQTGSEVTEQELIKFVSENISIQKQLHGGVRFVEQIPRTASGKILRRELKELLKKD